MATKGLYLLYLLPAVLLVCWVSIQALDKILLLVSLLTPLSLNLENVGGGLSLSVPVEPLLVLVMVLFMARVLQERTYDLNLSTHPIAQVIYLMLCWILVTTCTSTLPLVSVKYLLSRLWFVLPAFFFAALVFRKTANIHRFIWLYNAGLLAAISYTLLNHARKHFSEEAAHHAMAPLYNDHTAYGAALALFLVLTTGYLFYPGLSSIRRLGVLLMVATLAVATILSLSRAAWISLVAALLVFLLIWFRVRLKWLLGITATLLVLFFSFQQEIIDRLEQNKQDSSDNLAEHVQSISNISSDASNLERLNRWAAAFRLFEERPFLGWGPGTYQFVYGSRQMGREKTIISTNAGDMGNAHSEYIGPLAEMGVPGMLIVFLLIAVFLWRGIRTWQRAPQKEVRVITLSATLALVSYFTHGFLNNFLDTDKLAVPVWACLAIIAVMDVYGLDNPADSKP